MSKKKSNLGDTVLSFIDYCRTNLLLWGILVFLTYLLFEAFDFPY